MLYILLPTYYSAGDIDETFLSGDQVTQLPPCKRDETDSLCGAGRSLRRHSPWRVFENHSPIVVLHLRVPEISAHQVCPLTQFLSDSVSVLQKIIDLPGGHAYQ